MKYQIINCRYSEDPDVNVMFATNNKQEVIVVADEISSGVSVIRIDEERKF